MGLYGERSGALHVVVNDETSRKAIVSQLELVERSEISNPPAYGSRIVARILNDPVLYQEWVKDLKAMSYRIIDMRKELKDRLVAAGTPGNWDHIVNQIGMFSYTGLSPAHVQRLVNEFHIYLVANGRISMAGLNTNNIDYVAQSIDRVVKDSLKASNL
ncbi:aspartate transaminase AAT2 [Sugiyamaella lignohabitans]|uniref:Aspartate transaminase AAT2 n=1 Tax=Sugiyamaella lignohabitans TaxID=796027 RepID=A0A167CH57_9ASCO|nr:aspartate transaminase AAT2 [Sugiyamaella lignohabitans]ANB11689.1 aspartate transaminase AAT2 [Sugiyamaella lignohabitans]